MKKNYSTIVAVLSCILAAVCLFQNYQLKQDIAYLKTSRVLYEVLCKQI